MRRYTIEVGGRVHTIDVEEKAADRFRVKLAGRELDVRLAAAHDVAEAVISPEIAPQSTPRVPQALRPVSPESLPPLRPAALPPLPKPPSAETEEGEVCAPMPGTVSSVEVAPGDHVERGDVLLKLEAMKMQNAIRAPHAGTVEAVYVEAGRSVTNDQPLVSLKE